MVLFKAQIKAIPKYICFHSIVVFFNHFNLIETIWVRAYCRKNDFIIKYYITLKKLYKIYYAIPKIVFYRFYLNNANLI